MLKKINIFLSFILALNFVVYNAKAVETIKLEDEHLLTGAISTTPSLEPTQAKHHTTHTIVTSSPSKVFPTKKERLDTRYQEKEWFKINKKPEVIPTPNKEDPLLEDLKTAMHNCYKDSEDKLNIEKSFLRQGNLYNNTAYLTETFETINNCYETIGFDIISIYYNEDPEVLQNFREKVKTFYTNPTDTTFNAKLCDENCSLEALINNQIDKFKEFRTYLSELINNRPQGLQ